MLLVGQIQGWLPLNEDEQRFWEKTALCFFSWLATKICSLDKDEIKRDKIRVRETYATLITECFGPHYGPGLPFVLPGVF